MREREMRMRVDAFVKSARPGGLVSALALGLTFGGCVGTASMYGTPMPIEHHDAATGPLILDAALASNEPEAQSMPIDASGADRERDSGEAGAAEAATPTQ